MARPPSSSSLEYAAFHELHHASYLRYARLRTGDQATAARAVDAAFAHLASAWPDVLRSACPAALAWQVLGRTVVTHTDCRRPSALCEIYHRLEDRQADVVLLRRHLGLSGEAAAALMGIDPSLLYALLRVAERAAPPPGPYA
ncbi:hypothetical protein [Streptomyces varsoviensis]|uniref:hypothetical protein n=1 Tax=Streptomyces varsoviensis TaxID=67373 RepID=UPI000A4DD408|nr:hypothetical protein [Streptomyces varsoviensis]